MKACFYIGPGSTEWSWNFFPGKSPGELPVAGKTWCRHMVDQCSRLNVTDIYIADCYYRDELAKRIGDGGYWSLELHCLHAAPCANPSQLMQQHPEIQSASEEMLLVWGQVLPDIPNIDRLFDNLREVTDLPEVLPEGIWLYRNGKFYECVCPLHRMRNLKEYFELNFRMLEKPGIYNLPGYANNEGCVFGMDVMILPGCELEKPLLIQDNVRLERGTVLCRSVIIGKDVLVDEASRLEHSIVMDHTYIGKHMLFEDKIIDGGRIIDVPTETSVELDDKFLTGSSDDHGFNRFVFAEFFLALFLCIGGLPLYLLSVILPWLKKLEFFSFFSRVYPKCWHVLGGKAHLVRFGRNDPDYAFRYSDQWILRSEEHLKLTDDIYFYYNRSVMKIVRTVVFSLGKRLFVLKRLENKHASDEPAGTSK